MSYIYRRFQPHLDTHKPFDCGNADLNAFLCEISTEVANATSYSTELLATTYVVADSDSGSIMAYFSLLHDKLERAFVNPAKWNQISRKIPNAKRRSSYPALKIGRLAVNKIYNKQGIGRQIVLFVEALYALNRQAGCRFITVDAVPSAIEFYKKCNFRVLKMPDTSQGDEATTLMGFDLKSF